MKFTRNQIELACQLKEAGLPWTPRIGQYAYDCFGEIRPGSPFQDSVYFFLDYPCFVEYFGDEEQLISKMAWLPTWEDVSQLFQQFGLRLAPCVAESALKSHSELDEAYRALLKFFREL